MDVCTLQNDRLSKNKLQPKLNLVVQKYLKTSQTLEISAHYHIDLVGFSAIDVLGIHIMEQH